MTDFAAAGAHANIALIKYWGKRDASLILPTSESLSLTLDPLYTDTAVSFIDGPEDQFILDGAEEVPRLSVSAHLLACSGNT